MVNSMQCDVLCYVPYCEYHRHDYKDEQRDDDEVFVYIHLQSVNQVHRKVVHHAQFSIVTICVLQHIVSAMYRILPIVTLHGPDT